MLWSFSWSQCFWSVLRAISLPPFMSTDRSTFSGAEQLPLNQDINSSKKISYHLLLTMWTQNGKKTVLWNWAFHCTPSFLFRAENGRHPAFQTPNVGTLKVYFKMAQSSFRASLSLFPNIHYLALFWGIQITGACSWRWCIFQEYTSRLQIWGNMNSEVLCSLWKIFGGLNAIYAYQIFGPTHLPSWPTYTY